MSIKPYVAPIVAAILLMAGPAFADSPIFFDTTDDWSRVGDEARQAGLPLLVLFVSKECPYCEKLKEEAILPKLRDGRYDGKFIVRVFDISAWRKIRDFDGEQVRPPMFSKRYGVFVTPTVMLLDPQGGPLAKPIVGYRSQDNFGESLKKAMAYFSGAHAGPALPEGSHLF